VDMKKIGGYPHNGYPTDMDTGTEQIFIHWIRYRGTTTRTLPALLTSLLGTFLLRNIRKTNEKLSVWVCL